MQDELWAFGTDCPEYVAYKQRAAGKHTHTLASKLRNRSKRSRDQPRTRTQELEQYRSSTRSLVQTKGTRARRILRPWLNERDDGCVALVAQSATPKVMPIGGNTSVRRHTAVRRIAPKPVKPAMALKPYDFKTFICDLQRLFKAKQQSICNAVASAQHISVASVSVTPAKLNPVVVERFYRAWVVARGYRPQGVPHVCRSMNGPCYCLSQGPSLLSEAEIRPSVRLSEQDAASTCVCGLKCVTCAYVKGGQGLTKPSTLPLLNNDDNDDDDDGSSGDTLVLVRYPQVKKQRLPKCERRRATTMKSRNCKPEMVLSYHGTKMSNFSTIYKYGLVVPGHQSQCICPIPSSRGCKCHQFSIGVANGSAFGTGIYTALSPRTSAGYMHLYSSADRQEAGCSGKLLVCAVIDDSVKRTGSNGRCENCFDMLSYCRCGPRSFTNVWGDIMVSSRADYVCPLWEVTW